MEAWPPEQLAMGAAALQICLRFCKVTARQIACDSRISAEAASAGLYSQDIKLRVLVCYVSFCYIPDLNRFKNITIHEICIGFFY
jgi:hypothetical protein